MSDATEHSLKRLQSVLGRDAPRFNDGRGTRQADAVRALELAISAEWNGDPLREFVCCLPVSSFLASYIEDDHLDAA